MDQLLELLSKGSQESAHKNRRENGSTMIDLYMQICRY